jgi:hypothetical protein
LFLPPPPPPFSFGLGTRGHKAGSVTTFCRLAYYVCSRCHCSKPAMFWKAFFDFCTFLAVNSGSHETSGLRRRFARDGSTTTTYPSHCCKVLQQIQPRFWPIAKTTGTVFYFAFTIAHHRQRADGPAQRQFCRCRRRRWYLGGPQGRRLGEMHSPTDRAKPQGIVGPHSGCWGE